MINNLGRGSGQERGWLWCGRECGCGKRSNCNCCKSAHVSVAGMGGGAGNSVQLCVNVGWYGNSPDELPSDHISTSPLFLW